MQQPRWSSGGGKVVPQQAVAAAEARAAEAEDRAHQAWVERAEAAQRAEAADARARAAEERARGAEERLEEVTEQWDRRMQCVVCLDAPRTVLLKQCGHLVLCSGCTGVIMQRRGRACPICRRSFRKTDIITGVMLP